MDHLRAGHHSETIRGPFEHHSGTVRDQSFGDQSGHSQAIKAYDKKTEKEGERRGREEEAPAASAAKRTHIQAAASHGQRAAGLLAERAKFDLPNALEEDRESHYISWSSRRQRWLAQLRVQHIELQ